MFFNAHYREGWLPGARFAAQELKEGGIAKIAQKTIARIIGLWITSVDGITKVLYARFDIPHSGRIIKDVMIRSFGTGEEGKNREEKVAARRKLGPPIDPPATDPQVEDIDPADFFDPEEFGYRRGGHYGR